MLSLWRQAVALLLLAASVASAATVDLRVSPPLVPAGPAGLAAPDVQAKAAELAQRYALELPVAQAQTEEVFAGLGVVTARAKSAESTAAKLAARGVDLSDTLSVEKTLRDGVGARLTLRDATPAGVEALVDRLAAAFEGGRLSATSLSNFRAAEGGLPYLSEAQTARLAQAAARGGRPLNVRPAEKSLIPAGYTAVHLNVIFANGARGELQIRGPYVHALAEREHATYDARRGKRSRVEGDRVLDGLTEEQNRGFLAYLAALYAHARRVESEGPPAAGPAPLIPPELIGRLDLSLVPH